MMCMYQPVENSLRRRLVDIRIGRETGIGQQRESAFGSRELNALEVLFGRMLKYDASERIMVEEIVGGVGERYVRVMVSSSPSSW
jgi:hypothetical protein